MMEPTAFGPLALRPREFLAMTPAEFRALLDGWEWRMNAQVEREATWVAALMNASGHMKRAITPAELLGRPTTPARRADSSARKDT